MKMYKIGFTRLGGQGVKDGWQAVNISPDIPPEVIGRYCALQNSNVALGISRENSSVSGGEKIVTELLTDSQFVYLSKIKYGLADVQGRPSMFADSFICDIKQFAESPADVLRLCKSENFRFEIAEESETISTEPRLQPEFELNSALQTLGLDLNNRTRLIKCVYSVITSRAKETLNIIYRNNSDSADNSDTIIANTMYCIYSALFLPFRKTLTFGTGQTGTPKTIIFTDRQGGFGKYFDLSNGETNIPEMTLKKFSGYGVIDEIAEFPETADIDYFKRFENGLREYGCAETMSLGLYKLVWEAARIDSIIDNSPVDELLRKLNELLSIDVPNRNPLDGQILKLLLRATEKQIPLNDILIGKLARLPSITGNETLKFLCAAYVYGNIQACRTDNGIFSDFADNSERLTFEIREQLPVEIPHELFSEDDFENEYEDGLDNYKPQSDKSPDNPVKKLINIFKK